MTSTNSGRTLRLAKLIGACLSVASIGVVTGGLVATSNAGPECANSPTDSPTQCCVKVGDAPGPGPACTSNDNQQSDRGLLGNAPVVGNLPGVGGLL